MGADNGKQIEAMILTKSAMNRATCVTAFVPEFSELVRFVSQSDGSPIPYVISNQFNVLDFVRVKVLRWSPIGPQRENFLVDQSSFEVIGRCDKNVIRFICDNHKSPRTPSFMEELGNKLDSADEYAHSLEILPVKDLVIKKDQSFGKVAGKAFFRCAYGYRKWFSVTDPQFDIRNKDMEIWEIGDAYIVVSIPKESYKDMGYYKFVAAIYPTEE